MLMGRQWKPGDVAMVRSSCCGEAIAMRTPDDEWRGPGGTHTDGRGVIEVRPLVLIDPEKIAGTTDAARYIARLLREADENNGIPTFAALADEFDPRPPKPDEPTGLGAVVEAPHPFGVDEYGMRRYVRTHATDEPWAGGGSKFDWDDMPTPITVLSEGVQP